MAPSRISPEREAEPAVQTVTQRSLASITDDYHDTLRFYLNGTKVDLDTADPEITLLEYLRGVGLTGTKLGCAEGGCGACTVVVSQYNPTTKKIYHASVNACLAPLVSVDGKHVITVEGIGNVKRPHPAQERIVRLPKLASQVVSSQSMSCALKAIDGLEMPFLALKPG